MLLIASGPLVAAPVKNKQLHQTTDLRPLTQAEHLTYALLYPGHTHFKVGDRKRGWMYLGLTAASLSVGLAFSGYAWAREGVYRQGLTSTVGARQDANLAYGRANIWLWSAAAIWGVSVLDAWLSH